MKRKQTTTTTKKKSNPWKRATIILGCLIVIFTALNIYDYTQEWERLEEFNLPKEMCRRISVTPSWMDENGILIGTGIQPFSDSSSIVVSTLINQTIYFLYNPNCGACVNQIEFFGADWDRYKNSGFAIDCSEVGNG